MTDRIDCCADPNQTWDDDGEVIYPDRCSCICHVPEDPAA